MVFVVVVAMYISSGVFLLWLFAELCGAHFVVAFHCYCCRCCCLVLGFYFVFTLSTSLEFQFTLLLLFRAVTLPLCSLTHTEASKRERERAGSSAHRYGTDTFTDSFIACERAKVSGREALSGILCIPSLHLIRSRSQGCPLCICFSIFLSLYFGVLYLYVFASACVSFLA